VKAWVGWLLVFVCALIFAVLVDNGRSHLFIPDYIWLSVNLTLFLYLLARFVGRPMGQFLDTRREGIAEELQQARKQLEEAEEMRADVSRRLAEVESEVDALRERAIEDGEAEAQRISAQAEEEEARFLRRVEDEIARRETETRARLAQDAASLTAKLAHDLLAKEMTDEDRRRIFERNLEAMPAAEGEE
jgi:F-type H+-transporting ATPase subunit b